MCLSMALFFIVMKGVFIMAVNEQIVTGRKFRKLIDEANKLWQRISFWTKASDVEFNDGKNAETKFGAINGVTDSLTSTASNIAASAKAVKTLNDKVTQLSSNINKIYTVNGVAMKNGALTTFNVGFRAKYIAIYIPNNYLCAYVDDNGNIQYAFRADSSAYIIVNDTTVQMFCSWGSGTRTADVLIAK